MAQYRDRTFSLFDPEKPLVALRQMTCAGNELGGGDAIPSSVDLEVRRRLWMTHWATYAEDHTPTPELATNGEGREWMDPADGVTVTEGENGWYAISAEWLGEDGEKVHGAEAAETRAAELRETGDTKGVAYSHSGGGWYIVTAPWLAEDAEPIKVKGEDAAKEKAAELRASRDPVIQPVEGPAALVIVSVEGDEYVVNAPWLEEPEAFDSAEDAEARQLALRQAGPPEGWTPSADDAAGE